MHFTLTKVSASKTNAEEGTEFTSVFRVEFRIDLKILGSNEKWVQNEYQVCNLLARRQGDWKDGPVSILGGVNRTSLLSETVTCEQGGCSIFSYLKKKISPSSHRAKSQYMVMFYLCYVCQYFCEQVWMFLLVILWLQFDLACSLE